MTSQIKTTENLNLPPNQINTGKDERKSGGRYGSERKETMGRV